MSSSGHIGAFYFGPDYSEVTLESLSLVLDFNAPIVTTISPSSVTVIPTALNLFLSFNEPNIYIFKDIIVDFIAEPQYGSVPLCVKFTGMVTFSKNYVGKTRVKEYHWYWDYSNYPSVYETSTVPIVYHAYRGKLGEKFTVKLCVVLEPIR